VGFKSVAMAPVTKFKLGGNAIYVINTEGKPAEPAQYFFFWLKDPIYLQSVTIHSANGGKGEG
jgi:hypothetical protein